ncbi:MAG TPA: MarR family winged helix-turn-helix transcriptional regulator [Steroidobacteraceae bacterium]|nr:MarR family winged helix-turn-helix transcriptional regulator [Steroidobacteraceae bacterium]
MSSRPIIIAPTPLSTQRRLRLDDYLPYRLSVAANAVSQLIARAYVDRFGLTVPQWRLMAVLGENSPLTQQALCGRTVMDKVTVMRAERGLLQRRLLRRQPNAADGRSHRLSLTATGERMYAEVAPLALKYEALLLAGSDALEVHRLEQWLRRLQQAAAALSDAGAGAAL